MIKENKEYIYRMNGKTFHCPMDVTMHFIGGKWKTVVLWYLRNETLRFGEIKDKIPDITEKMLSIVLRNLEENDLVHREAYDGFPLRVEYSLTEFGKSLMPILNEIAQWGWHVGLTRGTIEEVAE